MAFFGNKTDFGFEVDIYNNGCPNLNKLSEFKDFAKRTEMELKKPEAEAFFGKCKKVYVKTEQTMTEEFVYQQLLKTDFSQNYKKYMYDVLGELYNMCLLKGMDEQMNWINVFQPRNPIHQGILLSLMLNSQHSYSTVFRPLQNFPQKDTLFEKITEEWGQSVLRLLHQTQTSHHSILKFVSQSIKSLRHHKTRQIHPEPRSSSEILRDIPFYLEIQPLFQPSNPIHQGIVSSLQLNQIHSLEALFQPSDTPEQKQKRVEITQEWRESLMDLMEKTQDKKKGGKTRRRRRR